MRPGLYAIVIYIQGFVLQQQTPLTGDPAAGAAELDALTRKHPAVRPAADKTAATSLAMPDMVGFRMGEWRPRRLRALVTPVWSS